MLNTCQVCIIIPEKLKDANIFLEKTYSIYIHKVNLVILGLRPAISLDRLNGCLHVKINAGFYGRVRLLATVNYRNSSMRPRCCDIYVISV